MSQEPALTGSSVTWERCSCHRYRTCPPASVAFDDWTRQTDKSDGEDRTVELASGAGILCNGKVHVTLRPPVQIYEVWSKGWEYHVYYISEDGKTPMAGKGWDSVDSAELIPLDTFSLLTSEREGADEEGTPLPTIGSAKENTVDEGPDELEKSM